MVPKIIHYCWFGHGQMNSLHKQCIESWQKVLPDYTIMEWNEENFDIGVNLYVKQAYDNKKYAFVSDYVRLYALYTYGGIYLDVDVEVKKRLDIFLKYEVVFGFESNKMVASAVIFSEKNNLIIKEWLDSYEKRIFKNEKGFDMSANVHKITEILKNNSFVINGKTQQIGNICIFEKEYFCPYGIGDNKKNDYSNSYAIHWCEGSWFDRKKKLKICLIKFIKRIIGAKNYYFILSKVKK